MDYQGRLGWGPHARKRGRTEHAYAPIGARERGGPCSMLYASIDKLVAHFIFLLVALHVFVPVLVQTCKVKSCTRKNRGARPFLVLCLPCAQQGLVHGRIFGAATGPIVVNASRDLTFHELAACITEAWLQLWWWTRLQAHSQVMLPFSCKRPSRL